MIAYTKIFYNLIGPKLLILLVVMQTAAIIEGFGISQVVPFMQGDHNLLASNSLTPHLQK